MSNKQKKNKKNTFHIIRNNFAMIKKVWRFTPGYIIGKIVMGIIMGGMSSAGVVFTAKLFNALDKGSSFRYIVVVIAAMAAFYLIGFLFESCYFQYFEPFLVQRMQFKMHKELFEKTHELDLSCYDDPAFYNDFVWAMDDAETSATNVIQSVSELISRIVSSSVILTLLFSIDIVITIILLVASILPIFLNRYRNKLWFQERTELNPYYRKRSYVNRVYHLSDYAKELRISRVSENLSLAHNEANNGVIRTKQHYGKKSFLWGLIDNVASRFTYYGTLLIMLFKLVSGSVMIGGFAASVNAIWNLRWTLYSIVDEVSEFQKHSLFIDKYFAFLAYEPKVVSGHKLPGAFESMTIKDISFAYNNSKDTQASDTLKHVSLNIHRGEKIAFVGYNGAGKTTLIKLIMRLYDPTDGRICYNGIDIREFNTGEYHKHIGTVFQDYRIFATTIAENVLYDAYTDDKKDTVVSALDAATFNGKLASLDKGILTQLTREFDDSGVNLSGGESQKIAIARVFARPYDLIIMDEPSSALDPVAEYELNRAILKYAAAKTVIFISHRLSTTRTADRIYMFDNGSVVEQGNHEELMAQSGKYAEMFNIQAEKYRAGTTERITISEDPSELFVETEIASA